MTASQAMRDAHRLGRSAVDGIADVILLDAVMLVMDGWTFRRATVHKPVDPQAFVEALRVICDRRPRTISR